MMKNILLLFFLALSSQDKDIEIGLVEAEFDHPSVIKFYAKPDERHFLRSIQLITDTMTHSVEFKDADSFRNWAIPEIFSPDYYRLTFRWKTKTERWLEVVINKESQETLWIKYDHSVKFVSWFEFLRDMFAIDRQDPTTNPIYTKPDDDSPKINYSGGMDFFKVKSIKDDWMEIYTSESSNGNEDISSGWIKWKKGNKLLINYYPWA